MTDVPSYVLILFLLLRGLAWSSCSLLLTGLCITCHRTRSHKQPPCFDEAVTIPIVFNTAMGTDTHICRGNRNLISLMKSPRLDPGDRLRLGLHTHTHRHSFKNTHAIVRSSHTHTHPCRDRQTKCLTGLAAGVYFGMAL